MTTSRRHRPAADANATGRRLAVLSVTALGVVYGDIGTSPLYAFRACFSPKYGLPRSTATVYGVLSLIVWSLILIVSVKYILVILRLDNRGEGGILALLALVRQKRHHGALIVLGLFGTALLYGDGIITPAISVLSAAEGIEVAAPGFKHYVLPLTLLVLFLLFFGQRYGTGRVGGVFGPIMLGWFALIGTLGAMEIIQGPAILLALNALLPYPPMAARGSPSPSGRRGRGTGKGRIRSWVRSRRPRRPAEPARRPIRPASSP
ncbi:MAG TPA: KUP/HAK/KT family potassium transporter [Candidatus Deferrimicrobiaceae bacterium]|nr:KUP/HAK/KT family potassium transporter [Candidatus Deferrimicrobiaceae bacterium]